MQSNSSPNVVFENLARNSHSETTVRIQGRQALDAAHQLPSGETPQAVFPTEKAVVVASAKSLTAYSRTGEKLWSRPKAANSEIVLRGDQVFYQNEQFFLNCVSLENKEIMRNLPMPGSISEMSAVRMLGVRADDFLLSVQLFAAGDDPPFYRLDLDRFGSPSCAWGHKFKGIMVLPPLYSAPAKRAFLAAEKIRVFDTEAGTECGSFALPVEQATNWCATADGQLLITGLQEGRRHLVALDPKGEIRWCWEMPELGNWVAAQPPIVGNQGNVCVLTERTIWCLNGGKLQWKFVAEKLAFGCGLSDGSFLFVTGQELLLLDAGGNKKLSASLAEPAVAPPAVDAQGCVHVATAAKLLRFD